MVSSKISLGMGQQLPHDILGEIEGTDVSNRMWTVGLRKSAQVHLSFMIPTTDMLNGVTMF